MTTIVNFAERQVNGNYSLYLPALSNFYSVFLGAELADRNHVPQWQRPARFEYDLQGMNYFLENNSYFYYPYGLYSAGHAERRLDRCDKREPMVHNRDREKVIIVGDSGGFQIATGVIKLDWAKVKDKEGDVFREEILRYLEHTADWSMTLDVPPFACLPPLNKKTGLKTFEECLDITEHNLHYFVKNRVPGKTKFLNVISGSSITNSKLWYDSIKHFSNKSSIVEMGYTEDRTLEGWAFAGINMHHMPTALNRLLDLREDNLLHDKDWIHFLGIGRLDWSCFLTSIMRQLQKHDNPRLQISFDAASPFVAVAYGLAYNYNVFSSKKLTYQMDKAIDDKKFKNSKLAMPFQSPIMDRLSTGDICLLGPTDKNKIGKIGRTSWASLTYCMYMAHNVYNHIQAVQEANRIADIEHVRRGVSYKDWSRQKNIVDISPFIPNSILFFEDFVRELFDPATPNPRQLIEDNNSFLESISFGGTSDKSKSQDALTNLFDLSAINEVNIDTDALADITNEETDEKLTELENMEF